MTSFASTLNVNRANCSAMTPWIPCAFNGFGQIPLEPLIIDAWISKSRLGVMLNAVKPVDFKLSATSADRNHEFYLFCTGFVKMQT